MKAVTQVLDSPLLTAREAAGVLRVSERKLFSLTKTGAVPVVRFDRAIRYRRDDLLRLIDQRCTFAAAGSDLEPLTATNQ
jgi:hypothetical protein